MRTTLAFLVVVALSPAAAQDKYQGTGMSVTGPASERKRPEPAGTNAKPGQAKTSTSGAHTTSEEQTPGVNSAISNSH
jgi:hypothetical protein